MVESGPADQLVLPPPYATRAVAKPSRVVGWPAGKMPLAPAGFEVSLFADGLDNPRMIYVLPNGDVLVMESLRRDGESRVLLFRDTNKDGKPDQREVFLRRLNRAFGMTLVGARFYVGNTDAIVVFPYSAGETRIRVRPEKILDLPGGGHYTRNITADNKGEKLYITVGSATNVDEQRIDEKDWRRAAILQVNPDGSGLSVFANGLRNPVGMDWEPQSKTLWTVVNERDMLGDELVPDFLTSVRRGAFYGWPYSYFGQNQDPRKKGERPDLVAKAIKPDFALGSHVAPLGLAFYEGTTFPKRYHGGAFIGMHGSWNRSTLAGYKVAFVPFQNGKPSGAIEDFLTGFIADPRGSDVYGRPVGVAVWTDGSLIVADDGAGKIWRVSAKR
ncbi:MAG TPA: sorbosone dehydrogenase family protein [Candidatus Binatia bacterium]|nr:sorbosone dehydrogenase family protein [Candidatus Binatia bacterium]